MINLVKLIQQKPQCGIPFVYLRPPDYEPPHTTPHLLASTINIYLSTPQNAIRDITRASLRTPQRLHPFLRDPR